MTNIAAPIMAPVSKAVAVLQTVTKISALAALAALITQIAANVGLLSLPALLKPIIFTTAFAIGGVTFSHFVLVTAAIAFTCFVIVVLKKMSPSATSKQVSSNSTRAPAPPRSMPNISSAAASVASSQPLNLKERISGEVLVQAAELAKRASEAVASSTSASASTVGSATSLPAVAAVAAPPSSTRSFVVSKGEWTNDRLTFARDCEELLQKIKKNMNTEPPVSQEAVAAKLRSSNAPFLPVSIFDGLLKENLESFEREAYLRSHVFGFAPEFDFSLWPDQVSSYQFRVWRNWQKAQFQVILMALEVDKSDVTLVKKYNDLVDDLSDLLDEHAVHPPANQRGYEQISEKVKAFLSDEAFLQKAKAAFNEPDFKEKVQKILNGWIGFYTDLSENILVDRAAKKDVNRQERLARRSPIDAEPSFKSRLCQYDAWTIEKAVEEIGKLHIANGQSDLVVDFDTPAEQTVDVRLERIPQTEKFKGVATSYNEQKPVKTNEGFPAAEMHAQGFFRPTDEDASLVSLMTMSTGETAALYAVFDGHSSNGTNGKKVADYLRDHAKEAFQASLERLLQEDGKTLKNLTDKEYENAFVRACEDLNNQLYFQTTFNGFAGSTMTMTLVIGDQVWCVNVGDSRTLLVTREGAFEQLSEDADLSSPRFAKSIVDHRKGSIAKASDGALRIGGAQACGRSFGDFLTKGMSARPKVTKAPLGSMIIQGCDGIFDVFTSEQVASFCYRNLQAGMEVDEIARRLVRAALIQRSHDNVSAVVVDTRQPMVAAAS